MRRIMDLVLWPRPRGLARHPDVCVVRCSLGLTIYTRQAAISSRSGSVAQLLESFLQSSSAIRIRYFRTSRTMRWAHVGPTSLPLVREERASASMFDDRPRHLFAMELADEIDAPEAFSRYREVDETLGAGCGYVQLGLSRTGDPAELLQLAIVAAQTLRMWWGVGGFLASVNPDERCTGMSAAFAWSRRFWGFDVQDPERTRWCAPAGIPSVNWLTLVGRTPASAQRVEGIASDRLACISGAESFLVRAGSEPTLGANHFMQTASAYEEAARRLAFLRPKDPPRFCGRFWTEDGAARWAARWLDPAGGRDPGAPHTCAVPPQGRSRRVLGRMHPGLPRLQHQPELDRNVRRAGGANARRA